MGDLWRSMGFYPNVTGDPWTITLTKRQGLIMGEMRTIDGVQPQKDGQGMGNPLAIRGKPIVR